MSGRSALRRLPGVPRVMLHEAAGRRARLTRSLTGASDWRRSAGDMLAFLRVAVAGTSALPDGDRLPWPDVDPARIQAALRDHFPAAVILGVVLPRQSGRPRLSLLCHGAGNPFIVKLGTDAVSFRAEHRALELLAADPLPGIAVPRPLGVGVLARLSEGSGSPPVVFVASSALGLRTQRAAIDAPLRTFECDLANRLESLPKPAGGTAGLIPVHGDLTPWNLRRTDRGLALFDWEAAGWGAPGSDLARYRLASDQIRPWWHRTPGGLR